LESSNTLTETTLQEARYMVQDQIKDGITCPCCEQYVRMYKCPIHKGMTKALILMYQHDPYGFIHVEDHFTSIGVKVDRVHSKLQHWDMIEAKPNTNSKSKYSGYWRITSKGRAFVESKLSIPRYVWLHNKKAYGFEGPNVTITDCDQGFDYETMMAIGYR